MVKPNDKNLNIDLCLKIETKLLALLNKIELDIYLRFNGIGLRNLIGLTIIGCIIVLITIICSPTFPTDILLL